MNLVYIDELLWHLNWTGDLNYARKIFPVIKRHLQWEKGPSTRTTIIFMTLTAVFGLQMLSNIMVEK